MDAFTDISSKMFIVLRDEGPSNPLYSLNVHHEHEKQTWNARHNDKNQTFHYNDR